MTDHLDIPGNEKELLPEELQPYHKPEFNPPDDHTRILPREETLRLIRLYHTDKERMDRESANWWRNVGNIERRKEIEGRIALGGTISSPTERSEAIVKRESLARGRRVR